MGFSPRSIPDLYVGRIERLHVSGFRRLAEIELEMRPFCVLIGANGVGKTSLLDAISVLSASANGQFAATLNQFGGLRSILSQFPQRSDDALNLLFPKSSHDDLSFGVTASSGMLLGQLLGQNDARGRLDYRMLIASHGPHYVVASETLTETFADDVNPRRLIEANGADVRYFGADGEVIVPNWEANYGESWLSQVPRTFSKQEEFRRRLGQSIHYHQLSLDVLSPVRLPQAFRPADLPGANGEDLANCLHEMKESHPDRFEAVEDALHAAFPRFERLALPPSTAGMITLAWKEQGMERPLSPHQLSEGTLRFLWLATLLQSPGLPAITLIDEPEVSLHPELLSLLADLMREASSRTQLIVATHADRLVRFLKPHEVVAMDINEDGSASATWGDQMELDEWLKDYTLDEVWQMGRMGGRS